MLFRYDDRSQSEPAVIVQLTVCKPAVSANSSAAAIGKVIRTTVVVECASQVPVQSLDLVNRQIDGRRNYHCQKNEAAGIQECKPARSAISAAKPRSQAIKPAMRTRQSAALPFRKLPRLRLSMTVTIHNTRDLTGTAASGRVSAAWRRRCNAAIDMSICSQVILVDQMVIW